MRFNAYYNFLYDAPKERNRIACHEVGHTVGLRHGVETSSCMYKFAFSAGSSTLNQHQIDPINGCY